jgi:hypothetical protein
MDALARELGVEIYRLEEWKDKALCCEWWMRFVSRAREFCGSCGKTSS